VEPKIKEKQWSRELEEEAVHQWREKKLYAFDKVGTGKVFSIDTPPPYVNTPVHIGQATTYVLMDMFARYHRMKGYRVLFPLGLDRNGLPIEMAAEKKFNIKITDTPREEFLEKCKIVLEEASTETTDAFFRLGIGFNTFDTGTGLGDAYLTDSEDYRTLTQGTFIDLFKKGLIYEAERINNYCPGCQTTLADAEVEYAELATSFDDIKFKVKETGEEIIIGTTRPELVCTCGMVIFHPDDERYKYLDGKTAVTPIFGKEIPIKAHPMADMEKGTGLVMMCSAGDTTDIRFFREMNLKPVIAIDKDGTMNQHAGFLAGLPVHDARKKMVEALKDKGLLVSETQTTHRTPICERSKHPIEFIAMKEWYLKQVQFKNKMVEIANQVNFFAPNSKQILLDWIESVSIDWPLSRRRFYATEVPLWYCKSCSKPYLPPKGKYYRPWKESPPSETTCECGGTEFEGDERVLDTWFDSSISPLYILGYERHPEFFETHAPCTLRPQGKEIIRTWLYYTLLKDFLLTDKIIFRDAWINYHVVDQTGHKMSKSKGNVIHTKDILDKFGAEPFRLWTAVEGNLEKTDFRCSFERIEGAGKSIVKLWNVAKFISMFEQKGEEIELLETDKWILNELGQLIHAANDSYAKYDFHNPAIKIRHFLWDTFASHYLEMVKQRVYNDNESFTEAEQQAAIHTLHTCLRNAGTSGTNSANFDLQIIQ